MESSSPQQPPVKGPQKLQLTFDLRYVCLALLALLLLMLALWQPWKAHASSKDRAVTVTGEATIKAEPDQYVFYPAYEFIGTKAAGIESAATKSAEITAGLKKLGLADKQIKTDTSGYEDYYRKPQPIDTSAPTTDFVYSLRMTVTTTSREQAQKTQDYLNTTEPTGSVSPQANFSDSKRKQLESQARDQATRDARSKADQSAKNLGFTVGDIKSIDDGNGFNNYSTGGLMMGAEMSVARDAAAPSMAVQPGENDLQYSVKVSYYIK